MPAPANDLIANAQTISGSSGSVGPYTIDEATATDFEDSDSGMNQTIWFKWVATLTGRLEIDTEGSLAGDSSSGDGNTPPGGDGNLDTQLVVYAGTTPGSLSYVDFNDDVGNVNGDYWSRLRIAVTSGQTYYIGLGTYGTGYTGTAVLSWSAHTIVEPSNNDIANATVITGTLSARSATLDPYDVDLADLETGETSIPGGFHSSGQNQTVWYKWVADASGTQQFVAPNDGFFSRVIVYQSDDGTSDFSQLNEVGFSSSGTVNFTAFKGNTYYIQVGNAAGGLTGQVTPHYTLSLGEAEVGECPTYIQSGGHGDWVFVDSGGNLDVYGVGHNEGDLLVIIAGTTIDGVFSPPAGWQGWDSEWGGPKPLSTGVNAGLSPYYFDHANWCFYWKIADAGDTFTGADVVTTFSGITQPNGVGGSAMYVFKCIEMGSFTSVPFADPPVLYMGENPVSPYLVDVGHNGGATPSGGSTSTVFPSFVADAVGNHLYLEMVQLKGYDWAIDDNADLHPGIFPNIIHPGPGDLFPNGQHGPAFWEGADIFVGSNAVSVFSDLDNKMSAGWAGPSIDPYARTQSTWSDGFTVPPGFTTWEVFPGLNAVGFTIQAPESFFPPNDTAETAYTIPFCPAVYEECTFAATTEGGDQVEGEDPEMDVWFKFTPATSETVHIKTDGSDYDTILAVYDNSLSMLDSDDDSGAGDASLIDLAVTAGQTYYIQVIGFSGDYGLLRLTLDCTGGLEAIADYWGILTEAV